MLPHGGVIVAKHRELAAVPVGTRKTLTSRSKMSENIRSTRRVCSSLPYGWVLPALQAIKASSTSGEAPTMLSLENEMGFFNGGGVIGWFMGRCCSNRLLACKEIHKEGLVLTDQLLIIFWRQFDGFKAAGP